MEPIALKCRNTYCDNDALLGQTPFSLFCAECQRENEESEGSWMARLDACVGWVMLVALLYFFVYHPVRAFGHWKGWW